MKKLLTIITCMTMMITFAQKKPNVNKAKAAMDKGDYAFAKSEIDRASAFPKIEDKSKTWFYKAMIYMTMDTAGVEEGLDGALDAFDKTLYLDPEQKASVNYPGFSTNLQALSTGMGYVDYAKNNYYAFYYNKALEDYNAKSFGDASKKFATAYKIFPTDTNTIINAGYAAVQAGDDTAAQGYFEECMAAGLKDKNIYLQLYNFAVKSEDYERALDVIKKARAVDPIDSDFAKYEIGLLIQLNKFDDAKQQAEDAIKSDPSNPDLYFSYATLLEESGDEVGAEKNYRKAIEIDPAHFNSTFNLGVLIFNKSQGLIKERNALSFREEKKIKELTEKIDSQLNSALPLWEKLYGMDSKDVTVLETLSYIYSNLKMNDKAEKIVDELDALNGK